MTATPRAKREAAEVIADIITEEIQKDLNQARSPVSGGRFKGLSSAYRKEKRAAGEPGIPNLEFSGQMRDEFDVRVNSAGKIEVGVFGDTAQRADGHNNFSGQSTLPLRQFLPKEGEGFRSGIQSKLDEVISEAVARSIEDKLPRRELSNATTKSQFFGILRRFFGDISNNQIQEAVFTNPSLISFFRARNLLRFFDGNR